MLNVFFTIDVEVWCNGWQNIDEKFAAAFARCIHGPTRQGCYGLPYQLKVMNDHGLTSVCFVEPLFSARFGPEPLDEIVGLVNMARHEAQLHLHTEWVDEARLALLDGVTAKRQHLRYFSLAEQTSLIWNLGTTPSGLWSAALLGSGRPTALFFSATPCYKAAKRRLVAHTEPTATVSPELCKGS